MSNEFSKRIEKLPLRDQKRILRRAVPRMVPKYSVHIPHPKQQLYLLTTQREVMYGGAAGGGKLQCINAKVLTPKGWVRNGDLKDGDIVVDPRTGGSATIVKAHDYVTEDGWIVETENGDETIVGEDHLWTVRLSGKRTKGWDARNALGDTDPWLNGYKVMTTAQLRHAVERAEDQKSRGIRANYPHIPVNRPVQFTRAYRNINATLPVDPYLLGLFIGDGGMESLTITNIDEEVIKYLDDIAEEKGWGVTHHKNGKHHRFTHARDLKDAFAQLGLENARSWEKFIPEAYKYAPLEWRYDLMQGLMDTDGYVDERGHMSYSTTSKRLKDDVAELARSLGAKVVIDSRETNYTYKGEKRIGRVSYNVWITPHDPTKFVSIKRKKERVKPSRNIPAVEIVSVRPLNEKRTLRCITLDTLDGLYITDSYIVTHNSDALLMSALQYADVPGYSALILRRTWPDLIAPGAILDRAKSWFANTDAHPREGGRIWEFPEGGRLQFGTLLRENDKYKYQCFHPDTQLLTQRGWIPVAEVTTDDMVASVDPATKAMSYERVSNTYEYDHDGELVSIYQQNGVSMQVTQNHTVWAGTERNPKLKPYEASDLPATATIPQVFDWVGAPASGKSFSTRKGWGGHTFNADQWLKFLGWYVSEGSSGYHGGRWGISISQQKSSGWAQLRADLGEIEGLCWNDHHSVSLNNKALVEWLAEHTGTTAHYKRLPAEVFDYDRESAEKLLLALVAGDGSTMSDTWTRYHTYSKQLADDVMRLAVHAGWRPTLDTRDGGNYKKNSVAYVVHLSKRDRDTGIQTAKNQTEHSYWEDVPYVGKVYCVETPRFNTLVTRHYGRVSMSGNSAEYQFIGFDELTHFQESQYTYMFSRIRRPQLQCLSCGYALERISGGWRHATRTNKCTNLFPDPQVVEQYPPSKLDGKTTVFDVPLRMRSACVDEGEVLTPDGWRDIRTIRKGEYVYSMSESGVMELKRVLAFHEYDNDKPFVRIEKNNLYMSMTNDHRVTFQRYGSEKYETLPFNAHVGRCIEVARAPEDIDQGGYTNNPLGWEDDQYLSFLGLYLAEGSVGSTVRKGNYKTIITQCKPDKAVVVSDLLDNLPIRYNRSRNGDYQITNKKIWEHFKQFGKSHEKYVPREVITNANYRQLRILFRWMVFGDGHQRGDSITYVTVSKQLADDVSEIGLRLGYKVKVTRTVLDNPNHNDRYNVYLTMNSNLTKVDKNDVRNDVQYVDYNGKVYCIEVEDNKNFFIRQRGTVWVSGNTNPGGTGHAWVRDRFINPDTKPEDTLFIPARLSDNPSLDRESYTESLEYLSHVDQQRLLSGDWDIHDEGDMFERHWFRIIRSAPENEKKKTMRFWDRAASEGSGDYTVGVKLSLLDGQWIVEDVVRGQWSPHQAEQIIRNTAMLDGTTVPIRMEQEPGSSGKDVISYYRRNILVGFNFKGVRPTGDKSTRATPLSSAAEAGNLFIVEGRWNKEYIDEFSAFPTGPHDDQVDATSGAFSSLVFEKQGRLIW